MGYQTVKNSAQTLYQTSQVYPHNSQPIAYPGYGAMKQSDTWQMARKKLKIHSNRQDSVAQTLTQKSDKTRIHPDIWLKAQFGNKKDRKEALDYILEHCKIDVMELEENYLSLLPYVKPSSTSI